MALTDPAFLAATFIVIDFEALTPAGRPPEPIEVGAIAGRFTSSGEWSEAGRFEAVMRPPDDVAITAFDVAQTGLTEPVLRAAPPQGQVMADLNARLAAPPYRLIAHSAGTEATLIGGQRQHCPTLAATPLLCTVKLARLAWPELSSHRLNECLRYLRIPQPPDRHRALPDVQLTIQVLHAVLAAGAAAGRWSRLRDLDVVAGVYVKPKRTGPEGEQAELF